MQHLTNKKIFLFFTDENKNSKTGILLEKLREKFANNLVFTPEEADIIMPVGGDGNFFRAVQSFYNLDKKFLPIGTGTRNFLLNTINNLEELFNDFEEIDFPLIEGEVSLNSGETKKYVAFNDFYMNADYGKMGIFKISGKNYPEREVCGDGIIVCTAVGSTGYNINAGGVVMPLLDNIWSITDINSRDKISHIIEAQKLEINITRREFIGHFDNNIITDFNKIKLKKSKSKIKVLFLDKQNFLNKRYL